MVELCEERIVKEMNIVDELKEEEKIVKCLAEDTELALLVEKEELA